MNVSDQIRLQDVEDLDHGWFCSIFYQNMSFTIKNLFSVYCAKCSDDVDALGKISIRKAGRDLQCNANPNQGRDTLLLKSVCSRFIENSINFLQGVHNDIELSFCMPTKSDVKDAFELDDETWAALTTAQVLLIDHWTDSV